MGKAITYCNNLNMKAIRLIIGILTLLMIVVNWSVAKPDAAENRKTGTYRPIQSDNPGMARLVFEAAYQAMLIGEPLAAARLLDHVSTIFPTPAVFNNAGIARALHAISLQDKQAPQLMFPWVLDTDLRLEDVVIVRRNVPKTKGPKWISEAKDQLIRAVLLEQKLKDGTHYRPSVINHLSIEALRGRLGTVVDDAAVTLSIAGDKGDTWTEALAWTALGVAYARCSRIPDAGREDLLNAEKLGYKLATLNLSILDGSSPLPAAASTRIDLETSTEERIEDFTPVQADTKFPGKSLRYFRIAGNSRASLPGVALASKEYTGAQLVTIRIMPVETKERSRTYVLLRAIDGYAGQTRRGLAIGSRVEDIRHAYGPPSRIIDKLDGQFLIYDVPRIVFEVKQGRLMSWMLYEPIPPLARNHPRLG